MSFLGNIPSYWVGVFSGLLGILIAQAVKVLLFQRRTSGETKVRLDERYRAEYIEIYKLSREVALDSLIAIAHKKTSTSKREFIVLAYELVRNNALSFIDKLDWRQNDSIIYLPSDLEMRCVRIRSNLYDGLSSTIIQSNIQIKHYRTNASKHYDNVGIDQLENWTKSGNVWPNTLKFKRLDCVISSPFFDIKYISALRDDLAFVSKYLKDVFTH